MYSLIGYDKDNDTNVVLNHGDSLEALCIQGYSLIPLLKQDILRNPNNGELFDWLEVIKSNDSDCCYWTSYEAEKYQMMTATEIITALFNLPKGHEEIDFTFDDITKDPCIEPTGWYGIKLVQGMFNEPNGVLVAGCYGGGSTETLDLSFQDTLEECKEAGVKFLQDFFDNWSDSIEVNYSKVCVQVIKD